MLKFVYILNFELMLDIIEHPKPSISGLKQPDRLAACYLKNTPLMSCFDAMRGIIYQRCNWLGLFEHIVPTLTFTRYKYDKR